MKIRITILVLFALVLIAETSFAIPAFARKYSMSCQTCHSPFPKLKPYGDDFAGNGFKLADKDAPRYFVPTGDDELSLIRDIPLAVRLDGYVTFNNKKSDKADFSAPYLVKFLSGGAISNDIAYYFYFFFSERGEVAGVEDAYIMFNDLFNIDLDLYVGQFQVSDPLFKREVRLTYDDYEIYRTKVGMSNINLTYDRGLMITLGLETGTDIIFELTNGNGIGKANSFKIYDDDKYKNLIGRVSQELGDMLRIGGFVYSGKEVLSDYFTNFENSVTYYGPDLTFAFNDMFELNLQYLERKDTDPMGIKKEIKTKGAFGELVYTPNGDNSKWYAAGLFNWLESDYQDLNVKTATGHLGYVLRRNIRLTTEYTYNFTKKFGQVSLGFISAF